MKFVRNLTAAVAAIGCFFGLTPILSSADVKDRDGNIIETVVCGDFEYSVMVDQEETGERAACVEKYTGTATDVVIPDQMNGLTVVAIGDNAFAGNQTVKSVTLPTSLMGIGTHAFAECTALENYYCNENSTIFSSKDGVLYAHDEKWLVRYPIPKIPSEIVIPEGVELIGDNAFSYNDVLSDVTFPSTLTTIALAAFSHNTALTDITIPESVTEISDFCFYGCTALDTVKLHDGITRIGEGAFAMTALERFTIPAECILIDQIAFADTKLSQIVIPRTVMNVGDLAFGYVQNEAGELELDENFTVYGDIGSYAEIYARNTENQKPIKFVAIGNVEDEQTTTTKSSDEKETTTTTTTTTTLTTKATTTQVTNAPLPSGTRNLIVGIIVGGVVLLGGIVGAIVAVLRKQKKSK